ncbi:MAG: alcohol dehydrogenase catalytic domain-containing protein [Nitrospiraceae bacterium]|nr:alcohol dehydrogenase catalytic domain-containing protein [Nitrospiraceae bacterium]
MPVARPAKGELLVKVEAALTCGTDLKAWRRGHSLIPMPGPFGHEFSGTVVDAGSGVRKFRPGDAVMAVHTAPCGKCAYCKKGLYNLCREIMDTKVLGAFGQYVLLPRHIVKTNTFLKPETLSFEEAAFLEPLSCVVHGVERFEAVKGAAALVFGAGPIGLLHLLILKARGLRVAVCALEASRLALAGKLGADCVFRPGEAKKAMREFAPLGADYVLECTGRKEVWQAAPGYARRGGRIMLFGGLEKGALVSWPSHLIHYDELTLMASFHFCPADVRKARSLLVEGKIDVKPLISGQYMLSGARKAFERLARGRGIKYIIRAGD